MTYLLPTTIDKVSEEKSIELTSLLEDNDDVTPLSQECHDDAFIAKSNTSAFCEDDDNIISPVDKVGRLNDASDIFPSHHSESPSRPEHGESPWTPLQSVPCSNGYLNRQDQCVSPIPFEYSGSHLPQQQVLQINDVWMTNDGIQETYEPNKRQKLSKNAYRSSTPSKELTQSALLGELIVHDGLKSATAEALRQNSPAPLLKQELKYKIQAKRLCEGKEELQISFDSKPEYKLRPEEEEKIERRKQKNRESAKKSRVKTKDKERNIEKEYKEQDDENKRLKKEVKELEKQVSELSQTLKTHNESQLCVINSRRQMGTSTSPVRADWNNSNVTSTNGQSSTQTNGNKENVENQPITIASTEEILNLIVEMVPQDENKATLS